MFLRAVSLKVMPKPESSPGCKENIAAAQSGEPVESKKDEWINSGVSDLNQE